MYVKQKHASRIIFNENRFQHSEPLLKEMKALNIYQLNIFSTACFMFKNIILKETPQVFDTLSNVNDNKYQTRLCGNLKKPYCKTYRRQKTIAYRGPYVWNAICKIEKEKEKEKAKQIQDDNGEEEAEDTKIFSKHSYNSFKFKIKTYLLNKDINTQNFY